MKEEVPYELIDQYLNGILPQENDFVKKINTDPELASEIELQKKVRSAILQERLSQVSIELKALHQQHNKSNFNGKFLLSVGIALILIALSWILLNNSKVTNKRKTNTSVAKIKYTNDQSSQEIKKDSIVRFKKSSPALIKGEKNIISTIIIDQNLSNTNSSSIDTLEINAFYQYNAIPDVNSIKASIPTNEKISKPNLIICDSTSIILETHTVLPCQLQNNGSIKILHTKGGNLPFAFSIDGGKNYIEKSTFSELISGSYYVIAKDFTGCKSEKYAVELKNKKCDDFSSFSFDPGIQSWEIPNDKQKNGKITIYSKAGAVVYIYNFNINEQLSWNGNSSNGELLKPGYYIYTLEYQDGSIKQGSVTISY